MTAIEPVPVIPKRKPLTKTQRARVFDQGGGVCHLCTLPIKHGEKWEAEHPAFRAGGGSDRIEEMRPAHVDCHKPKTADDVKVLAKTNRRRAAHLGIKAAPSSLSRTRAEIVAVKDARSRDRSGGKLPVPGPRALFGSGI